MLSTNFPLCEQKQRQSLEKVIFNVEKLPGLIWHVDMWGFFAQYINYQYI